MSRIILFILILGANNVALGANNPSDVSETLIKTGVQLRREGNHAASLDAFIKAHTLSASGRTMAQIGLARQSLHQWSSAEFYLKQSMVFNEPWIEKNRESIASAVASIKKHIGWLLVTGAPGIHVSLNERYVGDLPLKEIRLDEGPYVVKVEQEGYKTWSQTVTVEGENTVEMVAMLEKAHTEVPTMMPALSMDVSTSTQRGVQASSLIGPSVFGAGLAIAAVGSVIWTHQASGYYGDFNSGHTGAYMVAGGVVGMALGTVLIYTIEEKRVAVGLTARGPVVAGRF